MYLYRGKGRFTRRELCQLDEKMAQMIYEGLLQIKQYKQGIPMVMYQNEPDDFTLEQAWEKWQGILDEMIYAFRPYEEPPDFSHISHSLGNDQTEIQILNTVRQATAQAKTEHWQQQDQQKRWQGRMYFALYFHYLAI